MFASSPARALLLALALFVFGCGQNAQTRFAGTDISGADFGRGFTLTDHTGKQRTLEDFRGKVVTLFFGYTQCPDVCPTNMATMAEVMTLLGGDAKQVQVLFMTVDPERDTPQLLAQYVPNFHPEFLGLYGDVPTTVQVAKDFKVFFRKQPGSSPQNYTVDHTAGTYVYDPKGRLRLYVRHRESAEAITADIKLLLAGK